MMKGIKVLTYRQVSEWEMETYSIRVNDRLKYLPIASHHQKCSIYAKILQKFNPISHHLKTATAKNAH